MATHQLLQSQAQDKHQQQRAGQYLTGQHANSNQATGKVQIDFHSMKEQLNNQYQQSHHQQNQLSMSGKATILNSNPSQYYNNQQYSTGGAYLTGGKQFIPDDIDCQDGDPSPIYGGNAYPRSGGAISSNLQTDIFIESNFKAIEPRLEQKRLLEQQQQELKRRSIETKDVYQQNKHMAFDPSSNQRYQMNGAKSALSNYGTQQQQSSTGGQQIKQINKLAKVEKDPLMDTIQSQKRTLAKSQSQNRLVLVSPETLLNKNNADTTGGDKNSFFKGNSGHNNPDLLYKQHMQYGNSNNQHKSWHLRASSQNLLLSRLTTTKSECTFCTRTGAMHSMQLHQCSAIYCSKDQQGLMIQNQLSKKYSTNRDYYNLKIVNDLIYNENTHVVSIFKDYLILDDINEFLKRSYNIQETKVRLPKLCSFYDKYSQVFPNYVCLPESKYMFKNIQRKQKLIDEQYQLQEELAKKQHQTLLDEDKLFNTKFYNSYYSNMGDISMSKKQYEEQAKQISKLNAPVRLDQMRIDELVDRFLLKDSQSNIQLITTAGLDFSGFTNSTFLHNHSLAQDGKTPNKPQAQQTNPTFAAAKNQQVLKNQQQQPQKVNLVSKQQQITNKTQQIQQQQQQKKPVMNINIGSQQQQQQQQIVMVNQPSAANKRQKNSFNNNQQQQQKPAGTYPGSGPKLDSNKIGQSGNQGGSESSTKTTPRLQKQTQENNVQVLKSNDILISQQNLKQVIQASPGTKEAVQNYLNNPLMESNNEDLNLIRQAGVNHPIHTLSLHVTDLQRTQNLAASMGSLLSPQSNQQYPNNYPGESPNPMKSPQNFMTKNVQSNTRQTLKSQQQPSLGGTQPIANLKGKNTRLSNGGGNAKTNTQRKNASPLPQTSQQQQQTMQTQQSSRNLQVVSNSTQKSSKSVNSHAKYLSGGADQYQKLLANLQTTSYDTMHQSSTKKPHMLQPRETIVTQNSQQKYEHQNEINEGVVTGEDCDDGIADERFASPEGHKLVFQTLDDLGRKSLEGGSVNKQSQMMLLSSAEGGLFDNNFDQIKKHLELQCINKKAGTFDNNNLVAQTIQPQQNQTDKPSRNDVNSQQKQYESMKQQIRGAFENQSSNNTIEISQQMPQQVHSANKTPNKSSTHSKKSTTTQNMIMLQQNRMSLESNMIMVMPNSNTNQQVPLTSTSANGRQLSFSQTSFQNNANNYRSITNIQQRKGSNQHSIKQQESSIENKRMSGQINRQSFKDIQQQQMSVQTALTEQQKVIKRSVTGKNLNMYEMGSTSQTFGQIQPSQFQNQLSNTTSTTNTASLYNPTFISSQQQQQNKQYNTSNHQQHNSISISQQQQAANTVRVMTPSYSLASLSKLISPTQGASPMTMTVTLAGNNQNNVIGRKQVVSNTSKGVKTSLGVHQGYPQSNLSQQHPNSNLASSHSQNYLLQTEKSGQQQKLVASSTTTNLTQKGIISSKASVQMTKKPNNTVNTLQIATTLNQKIGRQQHQSSGNHTLQQSSSLQQFQITPRGHVNLVDNQQQISRGQPINSQIEGNSQNLSCTISTENNSTAKAVESKNPKFMRTIEEIGNNSQPVGQYNTMLSSSLGQRKSGGGGQVLTSSISSAQFELKQNQKLKVQTIVNSTQNTIKRNTNQGGQMLSSSASVSHFKSPSQQLNAKKQQLQGRYLNNM